MSLFSRLFSRNEKSNKGTHNAASMQLLKHASKIADEGISLSRKGLAWSVGTNTEVTTKLVEAIEKAIEFCPNDPDLMVSQYSALLLGHDSQKANDVLQQALSINPEHFDAKMLHDYPDSWQHLFCFPSWSEKMTDLPESMFEQLRLQQSVQIVRDCLSLSVAIVNPPFEDGFPQKIHRSGYKLIWSKTPYGPISFHYALLDCGGGRIRKQETGLAHWADSSPAATNGYWLLRRLANIQSCFIVFANGSKVLYNTRFMFPKAMQKELKRIDKNLKHLGPVYSIAECQPAAQWYMQNVDVNSIRF